MGNYDNSQGVWRTIRGRRVFIKDGEDLSSAMKRSGKFKTKLSPEEKENIEKNKNKDDRDTTNEELIRDEIKQFIDGGNEKESYINFRDRMKETYGVDEDTFDKRFQHAEDNLYYEKTGQLPTEERQKTYSRTERAREIDKINGNDKTIHTQSGSYSESELKSRDESIKQMYKDAWNGNKSYKDLHNEIESMKSQGKISQGELDSLQYDASRELGTIEPQVERFKERKGKNPAKIETYTKTGNIRYSAFGIERTPEDDFSDDGTRFSAYRLPNGMEMTVAKDSDDIYLSLRNPYHKEVSYEEYSNLPHYRDLDQYNGVRKDSVDLNNVIKASNEYMNEYNELLKSKGIKPETRSNKELRIESIRNQIERNQSSIDYYRNSTDYSRWRYNKQQENRLMRKNDRLRKELQKLL